MKVENPAILVVEDDENDQFLITSAFKKINSQAPVQVVSNGEQAIAYLNGDGEYADRHQFPFPTTILTDLKMPVMDGFSVLEHIKQNRQWAVIPTIVLSASADVDDIKKAFMLGAAAYHVKPQSPGELRQLLTVLMEYWKTCEIPQTTTGGVQLKTDSRGKLGERFLQDH